MGDSPIDDVLDAVRAQLLARRTEAADRVGRIKAAADAYLAAVEQDIAAQFAARMGLDTVHTSQTVRTALDLRSTVDSLPETAVRTSPRSMPPPRPSMPPGSEMRPPVPEGPPSPVTEEFVQEVRSAGLDEMPTELFRVHAEEFAARARHLQEAMADRLADVDAIGRVIRTLTAMVSKRGLSGIYGLSRGHSGDWQARADEAARKRQRLLSIPPSAPTPRTATPSPYASDRDTDESDESDDGPNDAPLAVPNLVQSSLEAPIVIVGGVAKSDKLERLRRRADLRLEWIAVDAGSTQPIQSLERRVRDGRLAALVVLQDLMSHKHVEPLVAAAQKSGVPWAYGGKAGKAALDRALQEIDAAIGQRTP